MGASLTSPLPHRQPTSVCNHLFTTPDAPQLFPSHTFTSNNKKHSMLTVGWNWSKRAAQQVSLCNFLEYYRIEYTYYINRKLPLFGDFSKINL